MAKRSTKVTYDKITFDSKLEGEYYLKLKEAKKKCQIKDFKLQVPYTLIDSFKNFEDMKIRKVEHIIDFLVTLNTGEKVLIDTKGQPENDAKLKKKMFMYQYDIPYYWITKLPIYLGEFWARVDVGCDFRQKLTRKWNDLYATYTIKNGKKKRKKPTKSDHQFTLKEIDKYFEYEDFHGLFYMWIKTKKK